MATSAMRFDSDGQSSWPFKCEGLCDSDDRYDSHSAEVYKEVKNFQRYGASFKYSDDDDGGVQSHATIDIYLAGIKYHAMFCVINAKKYKFKSFYTFVYAANEGTERRLLWEELINENIYVNGNPWCVSGDWNVTLHPNEHSCGSSVMTSDMIEFQECINNVEVEDLCRTGLHFTWTKNLVSTKAGNLAGILKKLDRVMANEVLIGQYPKAHAKFLPYIISDHTPSVLCIPTTNFKKPKAFRFSNFITGKEDFLPLVAEK
ncbi:RNA-directed DNA polymerase, eukaryota, reverse transcriptase zinc-binding domain protein, partial [Tanacetum coccineum]